MSGIDKLVDRFLMWKLPASVSSDLCVTDRDYKFPRSGTNLLSATEARQMIEHLLAEGAENPLDAWIEREFGGYGVAVRGEFDQLIPGEPFMSMAVAKELTRRAVAEFSRQSKQPTTVDALALHDEESWKMDQRLGDG